MKKILLRAVSTFTFLVVVVSYQTGCSKSSATNSTSRITDTVEICTPTIPGLWIGTDSIDGQPYNGALYWAPSFKPDGTLTLESKWTAGEQNFSNGNWTLQADTISGSYTCAFGLPQNIGISQSFKGIWARNAGTITGTWKNTNLGYTATGTFFIVKAN